MEEKELQWFRQALLQNRAALMEWLQSSSPDLDVRLGGNEKESVQALLSELREALKQIETGEFGKCTHCDGEVEEERLKADYTCSVCLSHFTDKQISRLEDELKLISKVQRDLLPCSPPTLSGIEIAAHTESAGIVGGDYYDFFLCPHGSQGFAIADVMDKGLPASMIVSHLQASLRILGEQVTTPDQLILRLNELFKHNLNLIRFFSIFIGAIDPTSRMLTYCNAGHHPPLHFQASSGKIAWLCPTGPAIGLTPTASYHAESLPLHEGDIFVFYTDGLVEVMNRDGKTFDEKKLAVYIRNNSKESAETILNGLLKTARDTAGTFADDVTLVTLKVTH